jgi:hypothetical protein
MLPEDLEALRSFLEAQEKGPKADETSAPAESS